MKKNNQRSWTAEEDATLRRMRGDGRMLKEIAYELDRPKGSVCTRAAALGLTKGKTSEEFVESRIGRIVRPRTGVLIHYARETGK